MNQKTTLHTFFILCSICFFSSGVYASEAAVPTSSTFRLQESKSKEKEESKSKTPKMSAAEAAAAKKIQAATDAASITQAATEFISAYPASQLRPKVASYVAGKIAETADAAQRIAVA